MYNSLQTHSSVCVKDNKKTARRRLKESGKDLETKENIWKVIKP
jgi:hypothetical protein